MEERGGGGATGEVQTLHGHVEEMLRSAITLVVSTPSSFKPYESLYKSLSLSLQSDRLLDVST